MTPEESARRRNKYHDLVCRIIELERSYIENPVKFEYWRRHFWHLESLITGVTFG